MFDHQLSGKERLRGAEAAKRPVRRRVRRDRARANPHVGTGIGARGVDRRARQDHGRQRAVGAAIQHDLDILRQQCSILGDCRPVADDSWMALGRRREVLVAVVHQANRSPCFAGQQRGMNRHDGGILLLAPKTAAGFGLNDHRLVVRQVHGALQSSVDVVGTLQRRDDGHSRTPSPRPQVPIRNRDGALRLDVQLFLQTNAERTLNHHHILPTLQVLQNLAFPDFDRAENLGRLLERINGLGGLILDPNVAGRVLERRPIGSCEQQNRLFPMSDFAAERRQDGLVVPDELDDVVTRDVSGRHDDDA